MCSRIGRLPSPLTRWSAKELDMASWSPKQEAQAFDAVLLPVSMIVERGSLGSSHLVSGDISLIPSEVHTDSSSSDGWIVAMVTSKSLFRAGRTRIRSLSAPPIASNDPLATSNEGGLVSESGIIQPPYGILRARCR